ncbi:MAG: amidohydrolase family protein [Acidimicrobiales bacterium]
MTRTVLRGARVPGDVAIRDGVVVAVGDIEAEPGDTVVRVDGDIITAGFINSHHHLYQWMTRGRAVNCNLFDWLTTLYPVWGQLRLEDIHLAAKVGLAELALSGCTTVFDHNYLVPNGDDRVFDEIVRASEIVGTRLHLARGSMDLGESDGGLPPDNVVEDRDQILESTKSLVDRTAANELVDIVVAPCSPFSVTQELMIESAALARSLGIRLHTHLAETTEETEDCLERFGARPVQLLDEWGWVADDVWVAHGIHFNDREVKLLGERGMGVAHCPSSNARLAAGTCRVTDLEAAGVAVGLGVDGVASNEMGRLFPELRQATYAARLRAGDPTVFGSQDALRLATVGGARCLGRPELGELKVGAPGDLAVWRGDDLGDFPDPLDAFALGPDRRPRHVLVAGRFIVQDGEVQGLDVGRAYEDLAVASRRLWDT